VPYFVKINFNTVSLLESLVTAAVPECAGLPCDIVSIIRWIFRKWDVGALTGWIWLRIGRGGGHLKMR
jgi:hypothetical protein